MNPIQAFINQLTGNVPQQQNAVLNTLDPRHDIKGNEQMTPGGFINNLVQGGKGLVGSLARIPGEAGVAVSDPNRFAGDVNNFASGMAANVNDTLGQPVATKNGQITGLQVPSVGEAGKKMYSDPLGSFLTLQGIGQGLGALKGKALPKPTEDGLPAMNKATGFGNKVLQGQYRAPTAPEDINTIANYGFTKPEDIANAASKVTGESGVISKMTRDAVSKANPVDLTGVSNTANQLLSDGNFIPEAAGKKFYDQISQFTETHRSAVSGKGDVSGTSIVDKNPSATYAFIQGLEKKAQQYYSSRSPDPGVRELAHAYSSIADELKDRLFNKSGADQQVPGALTPEHSQTLLEIDPSGKLLNDVSSAQNVGELRGVAAPFVRLSQAAQKTGDIAAAEPASPASAIELGSSIASGNPAGVGLWAAGTNAGKNLIGNAARKVGGLPSINPGGGVKPLGSIGAGELASPNVPNASNNQQNNNEQGLPSLSTNGTISPLAPTSLPQDPSQVKPDANGNYGVFNPVAAGLTISPADAQKQLADLNAQKGSAEYTYNPQVKNQIDAQINTLQNLSDKSSTVNNAYGKVNQINTDISYARQLLKEAPPNLLQSANWFNELRNATDPKWQQLFTYLTTLQSEDPNFAKVDFSSIKTPQALLGQLDSANISALNGFYSWVRTYVGNQPTTQNGQITTQLPPSLNTQPAGLPPAQEGGLSPIAGPNQDFLPSGQGFEGGVQ